MKPSIIAISALFAALWVNVALADGDHSYPYVNSQQSHGQTRESSTPKESYQRGERQPTCASTGYGCTNSAGNAANGVSD
ncbi:hypothetical protein AWB81_05046 [Caballeronia arationis]|uniref:hypothetical protein n=1 Tax=Caballeronia arationis TaxID=1777142 RepID=UPI00074B80E3|nr:hypothetical protein [Caballeronia arationis]SAK92804.1 hypothetical protein AWB81_05046 [Caballeronia arationis]